MAALLWLILAVIVFIIIVSIPFIQRWFTKGEQEQPNVAAVQEQQVLVGRGGRRRRLIHEEREQHGEDEERKEDEMFEKKIGTKKRKKMTEKAEKKAQREQEQAWREDEKKREALRQEEQKRKEAQEEELRKKQELEEKEKKELQEKKEYEEYLKLKADFIIEEEGHVDEGTNDTSLAEFIDYIKNAKVVYMEELASEFNLKTQAVIDRIHSLQSTGQLTGVIDDRGKFIYITIEELKDIAKFIRQRGRVTLTELAESSNTLIQIKA